MCIARVLIVFYGTNRLKHVEHGTVQNGLNPEQIREIITALEAMGV
jgi:hypothetical protein